MCWPLGSGNVITVTVTAQDGTTTKTYTVTVTRSPNTNANLNALLAGDIRKMSRILDDSWKAKQMTAAGISTDRIDQLCDVAFDSGALAGASGLGGIIWYQRTLRPTGWA